MRELKLEAKTILKALNQLEAATLRVEISHEKLEEAYEIVDKFQSMLEPITAKNKLPEKPGWYFVKGVWGDVDRWQLVEIYEHPIKGLAVFSEDIGSGGTGESDETDCHVSVQFTGLEFGSRLKE